VLIHRPPESHGFVADHDVHLIEVPSLAGRGSTPLNLEADLRGEFEIPLAQCFVPDLDAALEEDLLYSAQTEVETIREPQGVVDDGGGKRYPAYRAGWVRSAGITSPNVNITLDDALFRGLVCIEADFSSLEPGYLLHSIKHVLAPSVSIHSSRTNGVPVNSPRLSLLALLVGLGACATPPLPPATVQPRVVEVRFGGLGSSKLRSSLHGWTAPGVGTQNLDPRNDFTLIANSQSTFTFDGERYVQATFQLDPQSNPLNYSLIALTDPDTTLFGTAVSSLKKYDGSDADPAIAREVLPLHAMRFNGVAPELNVETASVQIWSRAELPAAPTRATPTDPTPDNSSLLNYGFVARSNSYFVTFAFKLPLQSHRQDDPYSIALRFASYVDSEIRVTESLEEQSQSAVATRAQSANATEINLMPGSTFSSTNPPTRVICAVTVGNAGVYGGNAYPDAHLFAPISTGCVP
jgi:hypothetical protein